MADDLDIEAEFEDAAELGLDADDLPDEKDDGLPSFGDIALHPKARVTRMDGLQGVRVEMSKVYRYVRRGQLSASTGVRMITMLKAIGDIRKAIDIEKKLIDIQRMLATHMKGNRSGVTR